MHRIVRSSPIVVVDDDASSVEVMAAILQSSGYASVTVPLGDSTTISKRLLELDPAVVFLDLTLGRADGRDIARQLRGAGSKSYLIACTGWGAEEDVLSALAAGFDEHWLKPFEVAQMRHWLDMHMPTR